jgi:hypothetical protein
MGERFVVNGELLIDSEGGERKMNQAETSRLYEYQYTFDDAGNRTEMKYFNGSITETTGYTYNDLNQLTVRDLNLQSAMFGVNLSTFYHFMHYHHRIYSPNFRFKEIITGCVQIFYLTLEIMKTRPPDSRC